MCGICGVYEHEGRAAVEAPVLQDMLDAIVHRGPDEEGVFVDGGVGIGNRRLSIIDLAGGHQPIANEDGTVVVVSNGEIYNYRELREELRSRGHTLRTASDTEVIVHLYEELGEACVERLRGMFAFAIWDARRRRLFIARDRLGIKPLYYANAGGRLVFGSEIKAILRHPGVHARLDPGALGTFLTLKYVPAPQTMFAGIHALPPGHTLSAGPDGVDVKPYWDLSFAQRAAPASEAEYAERLEELLKDAVRSHLVSDVPFGAFLSGGVDSSLIVALMSDVLEQPVKTFSVGFAGDGAELSELPFARMVAERYGAEHHEVMVSSDDLIDLAERVVWHLDQPIADDACLANMMVARLASEHVKMVLTGEGGDELFAGYARYAGERFAGVVRRLPSPARSLAISMSGRMPGLRRPKLALYALCQPDEVHRMVSWFPLCNPEVHDALLSDELGRSLGGHSAERAFAGQLARTDATDGLSRMLYVDTKLWLPDDLLARGDKMSMASSLEARVPLLDHALVEFAATLPPEVKVKRLARKYLLKRVARDWLPADVIDRKKQGFPIPMSNWFRNEARPFLRDHLAPDVVRRRGLFDPAQVDRVIDEHERGFADHGSLLWALLSVELWQRLYLDGDRAPSSPVAVAGP